MRALRMLLLVGLGLALCGSEAAAQERAGQAGAASLQKPAPVEERQIAWYVRGLLSRREKEGIQSVLGTTPEQNAALDALIAGEVTNALALMQHSAAAKAEFEALPQERRTLKARNEMLAKFKSRGEAVAAGRERLFKDLRAILTPEQELHWKRFEMLLRREEVLQQGRAPGVDRSDLARLLWELEIDRDEEPVLAGLIDQYERELDALLRALEAMAAVRRGEPGAALSTEEYWEQLDTVSRHNFVFAERIAAQLDEQASKGFLAAYERTSLPDSLGPNMLHMGIMAASGLTGLDPSVREEVGQMVAEYLAKERPLTERMTMLERQRRRSGHNAVPLAEWDELYMGRVALRKEMHAKIERALPEAVRVEWKNAVRQEYALLTAERH